jgi:diguanylate cyclase (GGDEF)-like protein
MIQDPNAANARPNAIRVLLIESDDASADRLERSLFEYRYRSAAMHCERVESLESIHALDMKSYDVVLTASVLPDACGLEVLVFMQGTSPDTPVIMTGGEADAALAVDAIRGGAAEFILLTGHESTTVPLAVEKAFVHRQLRDENENLQEDLGRSMADLAVLNRKLEKTIRQLEVTARTDELTGLSNRRWLNLMLEGRWAEAQRHQLSMAFLMLDLDGFKQLNDQLGHQRGDELLRVVGEVIDANCREIDIAARYGGDEFCILMPHTDLDAAMHVARRISDAFTSRVAGMDLASVQIGLSIGVGHRDLSGPRTAEDLVRHADEAMYAAKASTELERRVFVRARGGAMLSAAA